VLRAREVSRVLNVMLTQPWFAIDFRLSCKGDPPKS